MEPEPAMWMPRSADLSHAGEVAVVTGGASGIGKATAALMAERGASVVVADINGAQGRMTTDEIQRSGGSAVFFEADVSSKPSIDDLASYVASVFDNASILVNNAGIVRWMGIESVTMDDWDRLLHVNLRGAFFCAQAFLDQLLATRGSIVNVSSASALIGLEGQSVYAATKGGLSAMTRAMSVELGPAGVRVNAVCPGAIDTAIMDQALSVFPELSREAMAAQSPLRTNGSSMDVAEAISFLASRHAAFLTGSSLVVDGGLTIS